MSQVETRSDTPFWERGNLAPVHEEVTAFDLPVEGAIPPELNGLYARNGANPREGHAGHWFLGDGMLHGVSLKDGRAELMSNESSGMRPVAAREAATSTFIFSR